MSLFDSVRGGASGDAALRAVIRSTDHESQAHVNSGRLRFAIRTPDNAGRRPAPSPLAPELLIFRPIASCSLVLLFAPGGRLSCDVTELPITDESARETL